MTNETIPEEALKAAAKWWADALRAPRFDNGDSGPAGFMASMLAAKVPPITDEQAEKFQAALVEAMRSPQFYGRLAVDYDPDALLYAAAEAAGFSDQRMRLFPWKTRMRVTAEGVEVAAGYGAPWLVVWKP